MSFSEMPILKLLFSGYRAYNIINVCNHHRTGHMCGHRWSPTYIHLWQPLIPRHTYAAKVDCRHTCTATVDPHIYARSPLIPDIHMSTVDPQYSCVANMDMCRHPWSSTYMKGQRWSPAYMWDHRWSQHMCAVSHHWYPAHMCSHG